MLLATVWLVALLVSAAVFASVVVAQTVAAGVRRALPAVRARDLGVQVPATR